MASLTGSTIAASYEQLLSLPDGGLNGNTLVAITDGDSSTAIGMKVATSKIEVIPASDDANAFEVSKADGTAVLTVNTSTVGATLIGALTVGVDDAGHDVIFYGNTASSNMTWDTSEDDLVLNDARLSIDQDDNDISLIIDSEATSQHVFRIDTPANTTEFVMRIQDANSLTSGGALKIDSNSSDTTGRNLVEIINDHASATGAVPLFIDQDANNEAFFIDSENTTIGAIDIHCDALTSGRIARFYSDSSDNTARELVSIHNDHASAVGATCLKILQDSTGKGISSTGGIVEEGGTLKENLLPNSGFDVWSNSTLVEATGGAAPVLDGANSALTNNLVDNGGFDSATTDWSSGGTISSDSNGKTGNGLKVLVGSGNATATQNVTVVVGKLYQFSVYSDAGTTSGRVTMENAFAYDSLDFTPASDFSTQHTFVFEAISTTCAIYLHVRGAGHVFYDSVTLYEVTPGCIGADNLAMEGYLKSTQTDVIRQHNDGGTLTHDGSFYALKVVGAATGEIVYNNIPDSGQDKSWIQRYAGRTCTIGMWAKTSTASLVRVGFYDSVNGHVRSSYHTGGGGWEWLEFTHTFAAAMTQMYVYLMAATGATGTAYLSQPILVFGSSIGEGNYTRPVGEVVKCEKAIGIFDNATVASDTDYNLESLSKGMIPKGTKALFMRGNQVPAAQGNYFGIVCEGFWQFLTYHPTGNATDWHSYINVEQSGTAPQIRIERNATIGTIYMQALAVQLF